jgi:hypothetical protein
VAVRSNGEDLHAVVGLGLEGDPAIATRAVAPTLQGRGSKPEDRSLIDPRRRFPFICVL